MKKFLSWLLAAAMVLSLCGLSFAEEAAPAEEAAAVPTAYLMYADGSWTQQYWLADVDGITPTNAEVTGEGDYTVGLKFDTPAEGLSFTAIGIKEGEKAFPNYTIELKAIRVNGEAIEFAKGYTSSDDGVETRMNLYNEWVSELPAGARAFNGDLEGAASIIINKDAFASVTSVEVDFTYYQYPLDSAYIMFANADWSTQYWHADADNVTAYNADIHGFGEYSVALEFAQPVDGLAFTALGIVNGEKTYPGFCLKINAIRINEQPVEFTKGYTSSDNGIETRMNIYNEWVTELPTDARSYDNSLDGASPKILDPELFKGVYLYEIDFELMPDEAYIMYANSDWSVSYFGGMPGTGINATNATVTGPGTYTVGLEFTEPSAGLAFTAVGVLTGEKTFPGYFIDIKEIKVNGEPVAFTKGYTSSDDGVTTRSNIFNEWVTELPTDAHVADGNLEGAAPIIVDKAAFESVNSMEVTFDYIWGKAPEKTTDAPYTDEEAAELLAKDYNAYIGLQTNIYVFRNMWNDNYGLNDEEHPYFNRLTGWDNPDTDDHNFDLGGEFADAVLNNAGEYTVSVTLGETGLNTPIGAVSESFNLLFVSTDIPSKLVKEERLAIKDVKIKIGSQATKEYTEVDTSGEYVLIKAIDTYNQASEPFGYTMPAAGETISFTFTVEGLTE